MLRDAHGFECFRSQAQVVIFEVASEITGGKERRKAGEHETSPAPESDRTCPRTPSYPEKLDRAPARVDAHFAALSCSSSFCFCINSSCIFSCSSVAPAAAGAAAGGLFFCAASWSTFALCSASCLCSPWMAACSGRVVHGRAVGGSESGLRLGRAASVAPG